MALESNPVVPAETIPIETAIRQERIRLQEIEFETDEEPNRAYLEFLEHERKRGVLLYVTNF